MNKQINIKYTIIIAIVVAVLGFYAGTLSVASKTSNLGQGRQFGAQGQMGRRPATGMTFGEILSRDSQGFTIKLPTGGSQIVLVSTSTSVGKVTTGTMDDLIIGASVSVNGKTNADGSLTADAVQLRQIGRPVQR